MRVVHRVMQMEISQSDAGIILQVLTREVTRAAALPAKERDVTETDAIERAMRELARILSHGSS